MLPTRQHHEDWVILINLKVLDKLTKVEWITILALQAIETCSFKPMIKSPIAPAGSEIPASRTISFARSKKGVPVKPSSLSEGVHEIFLPDTIVVQKKKEGVEAICLWEVLLP